MSEWKRRPIVPETHPFYERYNDMLDSDRDRLLAIIEHYIKMRRETFEREKHEGFSLNLLADREMVDAAVETYFWKFINKDTRVDER